MHYLKRKLKQVFVNDKSSFKFNNMLLFDRLTNHFQDINTYTYIKEIVNHELWLEYNDLEYGFKLHEVVSGWPLFIKHKYFEGDGSTVVNERLLMHHMRYKTHAKNKIIERHALSYYYLVLPKHIESNWIISSICNAWSQEKIKQYIMSIYDRIIIPKIKKALIKHDIVQSQEDPMGYFKGIFPKIVSKLYGKINEIYIPDQTDENGLNKQYMFHCLRYILMDLLDTQLPISIGRSLLFWPKNDKEGTIDIITFKNLSSLQGKNIAINVGFKVASFALPVRIWTIDNDWFEIVLKGVSIIGVSRIDAINTLSLSFHNQNPKYHTIDFFVYKDRLYRWIIRLKFKIHYKKDSIRVSINRNNFSLVMKKVQIFYINKISMEVIKEIIKKKSASSNNYVLVVPKLI